MRGPTARRWRTLAMSPSRTVIVPSCNFLDPATSAISVLYRWVTSLIETTGFAAPGGDSASATDAIDVLRGHGDSEPTAGPAVTRFCRRAGQTAESFTFT